MPIHDQGYRRYAGQRTPAGRAWIVIARTGVRTLLSRRAFIGLLLVAWLPFLVRAVQMYLAANLPQAAVLLPTALTFRQFLAQQEVFLFFITVYAGSGLVANDRRVNALQIYLSKPLTRVEYIFGKFVVLATFLLLVTWVPAVALLLVQILFSGSFSFFLGNPQLLPAITLFSIIQVVTISTAMLALSSLSKNARYVAFLYAALIFFSQAMVVVMFLVTRSRFLWISMPNNLQLVGDVIFGVKTIRLETSVFPPFLMLFLLVCASLAILERRVRAVEVVQ
jgi:ABC-2 type transport system permease protein